MKALLVIAISVSFLLTQEAAADPLNNAVMRQRIGNYDFEVALAPNPPVAGSPSSIMLRLAGVNGDDLIDVPVTLRLAKGGGEEIYSIGPVIVPFGHYTLDYTFSQPGRYALYADLQDYAYSSETLTFTFLLNVAGPNDYLYTLVPGIGATAAAGAAGAAVVMKRRKKA